MEYGKIVNVSLNENINGTNGKLKKVSGFLTFSTK
jgi:hypothetical protein